MADRTGLSVHQLRAWERRHGAVDPERTEGGHRLYTDDDLRRLELLAELTERGRRIGQLAGLPTEELASLLKRDRESREPDAGELGEAGANGALAETRRAAVEAIETFDAERLEAVVRRSSLRHGLPVFVKQLVVPVLSEVGARWHSGELGVAQEHLASGVFSRALQHMLEGSASERAAPAIVVATPSGHRHEIGAMIAAAMAGSEGWRVIYLGADLPASEIARTAREVGARAVALSLVYGSEGAPAAEELRSIREGLPDSVEVLVGGRGASEAAGSFVGNGLRVVDGFGDFGARLRELERADGARGRDG
ncbi:MAG: MerR family transcriptional regulator [Gemmatimonadota bacterium]